MLLLHLAVLLISSSSSCFPTTLASPPPTQKNNTIALPIPNDPNPTNNSSTLNDIDARFRLIPASPPATSTPPIEPLSTYLNAITWLAHLAPSDFRSLASPSEKQSVAPWTDVAITWTRPSRDCETRFLIWGLWLALEWLRRNEEGYVANKFQLLWDRRVVGTLEFSDTAAAVVGGALVTAPSSSSSGAALDSAVTTTKKKKKRSTLKHPSADDASTNLTAPLSDTNLHLTFTPPPNPHLLSPPDYLHPIASALVLLSPYPAPQRTHWFYARPRNGCQGFLHLGGPAVERRAWPYLRNQDAVLVVYEVADRAARAETFAEVEVKVQMNGVDVARGEVRLQLSGAGGGGGGGDGEEGALAVT